ncbi:MAG TPA: hypothetical protein PLH57_04540, partial [Oligoflexia bacterium]|nr:hypothetical protein [Oligoflexia bacterium]
MIIRRAAKYAILSVIVASILGVDSVNAARRAASPKLDKVESLACREVVKSERSRPTPPPIPQKPARPRVASAAKETIGNRNTDNRLTRQIEEALSVYRLDKLFESARAQREEDFTKDAMFEDSRGSSSSPSRKQLLDYVVGKVRVAEITLKDGQTFTGHISEVATGLGGEKFVRIDEKVRFEFPTAGKGEVRYRVPNTSTRTVDAVQVRNIPLDQIEGVRNLSPTAFWHENVSKEFSLQDYVKNGKMYDSAKDVAELERQSRAAGIFGSYSLEHQIAKAENIREQARKDGVPSYAQKQLTDLAQVYVVEFEKTPLPGQSKGETVTGIVLSTFKAPVSGKHTGKNFVRIDTNVRVDLNKMIKELENPDTTTAFYNRIESTFYAHPNRVAKVDAPGVIDVPLADVQVATIRSVSVQEYLDRNFFGPKFDTADFLKFGRIFNSRIEAATVTHEQVQEQLESAYATESEIDVFIHLAPALKYSGKVHGLFDNGPGDIRVEIGEHRGENAPALREIVLVTVTQKGNASRSSELPLERSSAYGENDVPLDVKEISSSKMLPISEIESKRTIIVAPEYAEEAENVPNAAITQDINPVKRPSTERGLPSVATGTQDLRKRHARAHSRADTVTMSDDSIDSLNKIARKNPQEWERRTTVSGAIDGERLDRLWSRFEMTDNLKRASIRTPRGEF